jgi:hypothetical protein
MYYNHMDSEHRQQARAMIQQVHCKKRLSIFPSLFTVYEFHPPPLTGGIKAPDYQHLTL